MEATGACVDGRCFCNSKFSAPPGTEELSRSGNITKGHIIEGALSTRGDEGAATTAAV
jgi:hypothetical protein